MIIMKKLIPLLAIAAGLALAGCNQNASNPPSGGGATATTNSAPSSTAGTNGAAQ